MLRKSFCVIFSLLLVLCCFSACGEAKGSDAGLVFPIDKDPEYLDPQIISDPGAKNIISNCFEGLVTLNEKGEIVPGCAESWDISSDGLTYTFHLRQDCKWRISIYAGPLIGMSSTETNSRPVTAYDFEFGLTRALLPETRSPGAVALYSIKNAAKVNSGKLSSSKLGVKALDDHTLKITLEYDDPDFLYTLMEPSCMPCNEEFFEATGGRYGLAVKYLIYNGPFYINNWVDDVSLSIRRNDFYYDRENTMPLSVYFSIFDEQETRLDKLKDKTYSVSPLTAEQAAEIEGSRKYSVSSFNSGMLSLLLNCSDDNLKNANIRKAIVSSFDYGTLKESFGEMTSGGIVPSSLAIGSLRYRETVSDVSLYKNSDPQALLEKGLNQLDKKVMEVTVLCSERHEDTIRRLMQSWQSALGIKFGIFVEAVDDTTLRSRVRSKDYQIAFAPIVYSGNTAFNAIYRFTRDNSENVLAFSDKEYDKLVDSVKSAGSVSAYAKKIEQAENYLISSAAIIPVYEHQVFYGLSKGVSGTFFNISGDVVYFKHTLSK